MATHNGCISILLADDHAVIRRGLRHLLAACADMDVVGETSSSESTLNLARRLMPDVVLLDTRLFPGGFEVASRVHAALPQTQIIMLTNVESAAEADRAIASGADACLLKRDADERLVESICALRRGADHR